jgi:hypothetical protein
MSESDIKMLNIVEGSVLLSGIKRDIVEANNRERFASLESLDGQSLDGKTRYILSPNIQLNPKELLFQAANGLRPVTPIRIRSF